MIVLLDEHGYLPAGFHTMDSEEIRQAFVICFPESTTRERIYDGYLSFCDYLESCGIQSYTQMLDGSFFTSKQNPNDIDCVTFLHADQLNALTPENQNRIQLLFQLGFLKTNYSCDGYFCLDYPDDDPRNGMHGCGVNGRMYWRGVFGFDRLNIPKGVVIRDVIRG